MRNFFLFAILLLTIEGYSQKGGKHLKKNQPALIASDTVIENIIKRAD
jgi:hypothetical protein